MKKPKFFKFQSKGQILLLMTNALLLIIILTNYSFAKDVNSDFVKTSDLTNKLNLSNYEVTLNNNAISKSNRAETSDAEWNFSEPFVGEISIFGGNFAPRGWALCDGQLLAINQNNALFSILGTTYGGDGRTTFGLPDLRGRIPIHAGQGAGLSNVRLGESGNSNYVMPYFDDKYNPVLPPSTQAVNYIIALVGTYPSRN